MALKLKIGFLLCLAACVSPLVPSADDFLIAGASMGRVKLGQRSEEVVAAYRDHDVKAVDLMLEGMPAPAVQVYERDEVLLTAELDKGIVYRISTRDRRFKTKDGIGVESTLGEAWWKYGGHEILVGERGFYAAFEIEGGIISFRLDAPSGEFAPNHGAKILEILVVRR
jgi:hypothetical protein